jgi:hypothetical protein
MTSPTGVKSNYKNDIYTPPRGQKSVQKQSRVPPKYLCAAHILTLF